MAKLEKSIKDLRAMKVNIFSVGVGNRLNIRELRFMASEPKSSHTFHVNSMGDLTNLLQTLADASCQSKNRLNAYPRKLGIPSKLTLSFSYWR